MINKLHELIGNVCPIDGVADLGDNQIRIDFRSYATKEQKLAAQETVRHWPLMKAKENKLAQIEADWQQLQNVGWDCGNGHLGLSASDVALYSGAFALAKEAAVLGLPIPPIITKEDNQINFASIQEMTALLLQYGAARSLMSADFAARRRAVHEATTAEQLESI